MKRTAGMLTASLFVSGLVGVVAAVPAEAAAAKAYKNCMEMHKDYKGGVARPGGKDVRKGGGKAKYKPRVDKALYNANTKSDRDDDGVACEA